MVKRMADKSQPSPQASQQMLMMVMFFVALFILFIPEARLGLGRAAGFLLEPAIGFGGEFPVLTILLAGTIPIVISTLLRHYMVDWIAAAKMAAVNKALSKEMRETMAKKNMAKMKKLNEARSEIMKEFLPVQMAQLKPTGFTMILFIIIFAWLSSFVYNPWVAPTFAVPWSYNAFLREATVLPHWLLLYSLLTLPLSMVLSRVLKFITFSRKLREMGEG
ncbi:MAG: DUF106 domain-containing protein [Thermoplasmata archaeon]